MFKIHLAIGALTAAMFAMPATAHAYGLVHAYTGLCLEDSGGTWARLEPCTGDDDQQWFERSVGSAYVIHNYDTGRCLEVKDFWGTDFLSLQTCDSLATQDFRKLRQSGAIHKLVNNADRSVCVDNSFRSGVGTVPWFHPCHGGPAQQWIVTPL